MKLDEFNTAHLRVVSVREVLRLRGVQPCITPELLAAFSAKLGYEVSRARFARLLSGKRKPTVQEDTLLRYYYGIAEPLCCVDSAEVEALRVDFYKKKLNKIA